VVRSCSVARNSQVVKSAQIRDLAIFTKWSNPRLVKFDQCSNLRLVKFQSGQIQNWSSLTSVEFDQSRDLAIFT